jgi:hypothetical protein
MRSSDHDGVELQFLAGRMQSAAETTEAAFEQAPSRWQASCSLPRQLTAVPSDPDTEGISIRRPSHLSKPALCPAVQAVADSPRISPPVLPLDVIEVICGHLCLKDRWAASPCQGGLTHTQGPLH